MAAAAGVFLLPQWVLAGKAAGVPVCAHIGVYGGKFDARQNRTQIWEQAFAGIAAAGFEGIELTEAELLQDDAVAQLSRLSRQYGLPVSGATFGANMWDRERHDATLQDSVLISGRLQQLGGKTFGVSVGDAGRDKTDEELNLQAVTLQEIVNICAARKIDLVLHHQAHELRNDLHELHTTLEMVPDLKLAADLEWLVRSGIEPAVFIRQFAGRTACLRLVNLASKDFSGSEKFDLAATGQALLQVNFKGKIIVELSADTQPSSVAVSWRKSRAFVRQTFGW